MKESKRIWRGEQAKEFATWAVPTVDESAADALRGADAGGAHLLTTHQVDQLRSEVEREAHAGGYAAGLEAGRQEMLARLKRMDDLLHQLIKPFEDLDRQVEQDLLSLAVILAQHLIRRELKVEPKQILGAVRDCMELLPSSAREVSMHLHPEDASIVREYFGDSHAQRPWTLVEDPTLERGSLWVKSDTSVIDGRIATRLNEIVGQALGTGRGAEDDD